jgi:hypothetical protein
MSGTLQGDGRKSKRKRAYYRALVRMESWALVKQSHDLMVKKLNKTLFAVYKDAIKESIYGPNKFAGLSSQLK